MSSARLKEFLDWRPRDEKDRLADFEAFKALRAAPGIAPAPVSSGPARAAHTPVLLSDALREPSDANEWLIHQLLAKGGLAMLSAEPYVGKSAMAGWLGLQISAGRDVLGARTNGRVPVLYWQGEGSRALFCQRLEGAAVKLGLNVATLPFYMQSPGFLTDFSAPEFEPAVAAASERGVKVIVCDTLAYFWQGEENSAKDFRTLVVRPLKEAARKHEVAFLLVHHFGKPSETKAAQHKVRGTSAMFGDFDLFLRLERDKSDSAMRVLFFDKVKDAPERPPLMLRFDKESGVFTEEREADIEGRRLDEKASQEKAKVDEVIRKILSLVNTNPGITGKEVAEEAHVRKEIALKALDRLAEAGDIYRQKDGPKGKFGWHRSTTPRQRALAEEEAKRNGEGSGVPGGSQ